MPVLEARHDGRQLIVDVVVAEPAYRGSFRTGQGRGLIDTGASASLITRRFAVELALPPRGKHPLVSVHGTNLVDRHDFRLGFVVGGGGEPPRPWILDAELTGSEFVSHANFDVIVGMDVLRTGDLVLRRDGSFSFTF